jgi:hypothetical protein
MGTEIGIGAFTVDGTLQVKTHVSVSRISKMMSYYSRSYTKGKMKCYGWLELSRVRCCFVR